MMEKASRLFLRKVHPKQYDRPCDFVKVVRSKKGRTFFLPEHKSVVVIPAATESWRCEEAPVPKRQRLDKNGPGNPDCLFFFMKVDPVPKSYMIRANTATEAKTPYTPRMHETILLRLMDRLEYSISCMSSSALSEEPLLIPL